MIHHDEVVTHSFSGSGSGCDGVIYNMCKLCEGTARKDTNILLTKTKTRGKDSKGSEGKGSKGKGSKGSKGKGKGKSKGKDTGKGTG
jgi:hypothetical protein